MAVALLLAALTFSWRLGSSSLFIDETYSWRAAAASFAGVFSRVRATEVAPPAYYLLLHSWIRVLGSESVWSMRLLSMIGGLALVGSMWWLGRLIGGGRAGLIAALLAALSPLVIEYAQEVRAYVFAMLCATIAVASAVQAARRDRDQRRWMALSASASVATIWLHYTGLLVILPLAVYVWTSPSLARSVRRAYTLACAASLLIIAPLMAIQLRAGHQGGVAPYAKPTATNFARVLGTPFDGRFPPHAAAYLSGAAIVCAALVCLLWRMQLGGAAHEQRLILGACLTPVVAISTVTVAASALHEQTYYAMITRYSAVATPFMLVAIAVALVRAPRPLSIALAALVAVSLASGLPATYATANQQPNLRGAFSEVARRYRAGDTVVLAGAVAQPGDADYYLAALRRQHPGTRIARLPWTLPPATAGPLWVVCDTGSEAAVAADLARYGWHARSSRTFDPGIELTVAVR